MNTEMSPWELALTIAVWAAVVVVFFYYRHRAITEQREADAASRRRIHPPAEDVLVRDLAATKNPLPGQVR